MNVPLNYSVHFSASWTLEAMAANERDSFSNEKRNCGAECLWLLWEEPTIDVLSSPRSSSARCQDVPSFGSSCHNYYTCIYSVCMCVCVVSLHLCCSRCPIFRQHAVKMSHLSAVEFMSWRCLVHHSIDL